MQLIRDSIDLDEFMSEGEESHAVNPASAWLESLIDHFYKPAEAPKLRLPWICSQSIYNVREGEVTLWAGINGHGKSMITSQIAAHFCEKGERVCLASLEMQPTKTMARMARQCHGTFEPTVKYLEDLSAWTDGKLWIYDHLGTCKAEKMLAVIRYSIAKFGITQFFVDNLMKIVSGSDDYNAQKDFVNALTAIAKDTGCHIHLVLHIKKLKDEETMPNKFDIKGCSEISDLVDNIFIIWRNKKKEIKERDSGDKLPDEPDAMLILEKQRHAEEMDAGIFYLWFDHSSMQYLEDRHAHPRTMGIEKFSYEVDF